MNNAPIASTIIAFALLPVAGLFVHAYISGIRKRASHSFTGMLAIKLDLLVSIGYMIYRSFGGQVQGSTIHLEGAILGYFIVHGTVSLVVIILEITILCERFINRKKPVTRFHAKAGKILFFIWWFAFLSGELFYLVYYVI